MELLARGQRWVMWRLFAYRLRHQDRINRAFDKRFGTETASEVRLSAAGVPEDIAERGRGLYRPFWESEFVRALRSVGLDFTQFTFIDIGSGKGKLLLLASLFPFKEIIGVEYAPLLHEISLRNCLIYKSPEQKCRNIRPVLEDALRYRFPKGPLICFIGNALDPQNMRVVLRNIENEAAAESRPIIIIYASLRTLAESGGALGSLQKFQRVRGGRRFAVLANGEGNDLIAVSRGR